MATLKQVHSAQPLIAGVPGCAGEGDALITNQPGLAVSIRTADCLPILVADRRTRAVAAIHAGWRGTAGKIVHRTIGEMRAGFDTEPSDLCVAIGPGIGPCCYQVGDEVSRQFGLSGTTMFDLAAENRKQLVEAGVTEGCINLLNKCTFCDPAHLHSYRRDKEQAGRMVSYILIR